MSEQERLWFRLGHRLESSGQLGVCGWRPTLHAAYNIAGHLVPILAPLTAPKEICASIAAVIRGTAFFMLAGTQVVLPQSVPAPRIPQLHLLPTNTSSQTVQWTYFLTGSFGGVGSGWSESMIEQGQIEVELGYQGKPAKSVKLVAYIPGCLPITLSQDVKGVDLQQPLPCRSVMSVPLNGKIKGVSGADHTELVVDYLLPWSHYFFGIYDGPVPYFRIAKSRIERDGSFRISVPDLAEFEHAHPDSEKGYFRLWLKDSVTSNRVAELKSEDWTTVTGDLPIREEYPDVVPFTAKK